MWKSQQNVNSLPLSQNVRRQDDVIIKCADAYIRRVGISLLIFEIR